MTKNPIPAELHSFTALLTVCCLVIKTELEECSSMPTIKALKYFRTLKIQNV
jgi:hypothetical protein